MFIHSRGFFLTNLLVDSVCSTHKESTLSCHVINAITYFGGWYDADGVSQIMLFSLHHQESFPGKKLPLRLVHAVFLCSQVSRKKSWAGCFVSLLCCQCISLSTFLFSLKKNYRDKVGDPSGRSHSYELNVVYSLSTSCHVFHFLPHKQHEHDFIWKIKGQIFFQKIFFISG